LPVNEKKLNLAFRSARSVILIFSVRESGKFQGKDKSNLLLWVYENNNCSDSDKCDTVVP
jgi:hypothetical protein